MNFNSIVDLFNYAKRDKYMVSDEAWVEDKHSRYKIGETAEWKDGIHQKTSHGWIKVKADRDRYKVPIGEIKSLSKLKEEQITRPTCSLRFPPITSEAWEKQMDDNRPLLLKKNVSKRMSKKHHEIKDNGLNHKDVLINAIYNSDRIMHCKPQDEPFYYAAVKKSGSKTIKIETKNCVAVLDVNPNNKYIEIVDWRWVRDKSVKHMENQERKNNNKLKNKAQ